MVMDAQQRSSQGEQSEQKAHMSRWCVEAMSGIRINSKRNGHDDYGTQQHGYMHKTWAFAEICAAALAAKSSLG
jgi:hypothetical protein